MSKLPALRSLFSQKLDGAIFASYFLGAVVPTMALGFVMQRYALPAVENDSYTSSVLIGSMLAIGVLSLAAFFALRRISREAMARMDVDNERLQAILEASRGLAAAPHAHVATELAAGCALRLTGASGVLVLQHSDPGKPFELREAAGKGAAATFERYPEEIAALARQTIECGCPSAIEALGDDALALAVPMSAEGGPNGAFVALRDISSARRGSAFDSGVVDAFRTLARLAGVTLAGAELRDSQQNFFTHVTDILVSALDAHAAARFGHAGELAELANRIGRQLELDEKRLRRLHFASLLHDIGMLKLSAAQQQSPSQRARHPVIGYRMLNAIRLWQPLAEVVLHHHDHFDGAEREGNLGGESIPIESRIIHLADVYMCMLQLHRENPELARAEALHTIAEGKGTLFDPAVVNVFEQLVRECAV